MKKLFNFNEKQKKWLLITAVFLISFITVTHQIRDYDFWFHYDCGRYIVENHQIPNTAIGSWYGLEKGLPWISHEWAFGLIAYYIANIFGIGSLPFISGLFMAGLITWVVAYNIDKSIKRPLVTIILVELTSIVLISATVMRPQLFLYFFTIALYMILRKEIDSPGREIYLLIPLTILWVNLHGGSYILLFFFSILFFLLDAVHFKLGRLNFKGSDKKTNIKRLIVLIICLLSVGINAHGLEMYSYPFVNMSDEVMLKNISEWQPLNINKFDVVYLIMPIIYFMVVLLDRKKDEIDGFDFLFMLAFVAMSFKAVRFSIQMNLLALLLIEKNSNFSNKDKNNRLTYNIIIPTVYIGLAVIFVTNTIGVKDNPIDMSVLPSNEVIEKIKEEAPKRLYNHYNYGGYLLYEEVPVFIDGRADIYSAHNMEDFDLISSCKYGFEGLLEQYNFDYFLINKNESLYDYLTNNKYEKIIESGDAVFFKGISDER